ncbi:PKD domain-containing protein [bacterium]|nr:PKD domain-containing protein [bacterium]
MLSFRSMFPILVLTLPLLGCSVTTPVLNETTNTSDPVVIVATGQPPAEGLPPVPADVATDHPGYTRATNAQIELALAGSEACQRSEGNTQVGDPESLLQLEPDELEPAWAIYRFTELSTENLPEVVRITFENPLPENFYLGIADYNGLYWHWQEYHPVDTILFSGVPTAWMPVSEAGNAYLAIVTYDGVAATVCDVTLLINTEAPPPVGLVAAQGGHGAEIGLDWEPVSITYPGSEFEGLRLDRAENPDGPWTPVADLPPSATEYADTWDADANPIPYAIPLYYRLRSVVADEIGPPGEVVSGWRDLARIEVVDATHGEYNERLVVSWEAIPGADGYDLQYRPLPEGEPPSFEPLWHVDGGLTLEFEHTTAYPPGNHCQVGVHYDYQVRATVGPNVCDDWSETGQGYINALPETHLTATNYSGPRPLTVTFDGSDSSDPDGGPLTYSWDWESDGTYDLTEETGVVSHTFMDEGSYQANMRVTDDEGTSQEHWHLAYVSGWLHSWSSIGEFGAAVATDASNNVYVTGTTDSQAGSGQDGVILKYDSSGNLQWARRYSATSDEYLMDLALDAAGDIHAIGVTTSVGQGAWDVLLLKLSPAGNLLWQKTWGTTASDWGFKICRFGDKIAVCGYTYAVSATDAAGLLLVIDATTGAVDYQKSVSNGYQVAFEGGIDALPGNVALVVGGLCSLPSSGAAGYVAILDPSTGLLLNESMFDSGGFTRFNSLSVDQSQGYICLCGMSSCLSPSYEQVVLMYDINLMLVWAKYLGNSTDYDDAQGVIFDSDKLYVSGYGSFNTDYWLTLVELNMSGAITHYWQAYGDESRCSGTGITVDTAGHVVITGGSHSAYQQFWPGETPTQTATGTVSVPGSTFADLTGTVTDQLVTFMTATGAVDENNNDQNAIFVADLDMSVL